MLQKRKFLKNKQILLKLKFLNLEFLNLIKKSFFKNQYIYYIDRISINTKKYFFFKKSLFFFKSHQKLLCMITGINKVPNKHYNYSRFYLNKQMNQLTISNTIK